MKVRRINRIVDVAPVELRPGIMRRTLVHDADHMLCHFHLDKGAVLELHSHEAAQIGYVLSGKVEFFKEDGSSFVVIDGGAYYFSSWEKHGSRVLEDTDFVEFFSPGRPEYVDD
ncbi:cupin domain-containing protein [Marispirochaeta aestuarii]|uniref:cupin domain-containing protein n=1 Tax=Marispirochaeta aestuarii TaxID=1963862 RepID=UPI0029C7AE3E|nr:cupin domain-containing protein [Marispirochaeta aestuarii]